MSGTSRAGSNTIFLVVKVLASSLFGLMQMMIFTRFLALGEMGLLQALRGLASFMVALFLLGLPNLAMRFIPQLEVRGERGRILRFAAALLAGLLGSFAVLSWVAWHWRVPLAGRFGVAGELLPEVLWLALGMGLTEFLYASSQGLRRMGPVALAELLGIGLATAHIFLLRESLDPAGALRILAIYSFLRCAIMLPLIGRGLPAGKRTERVLRMRREDLLNYWGLSIVLRWLALAYLDIDRYVIGMVGALDLVALFHVPAKLVGLNRSLLAAPTVSLQIEVSRFYEERRESELSAHLQLFLRVQMVFTFWLAGLLFLLARPLILLTSTSEYLQALPLLLLLLFMLPLTSLAAPMEAAFRGMQGLKVILIGNLIWAVAYFGSLGACLRHWGLLGLGLAQLGAALLQVSWVLGAARRMGWLRGLGRRLAGNLAWTLILLIPALGLSLLLPGSVGPAPATAGILLGALLLAAGASFLLITERLFSRQEKTWLLGRVPGEALRGRLTALFRAGTERS